jgi:hypothetical protein
MSQVVARPCGSAGSRVRAGLETVSKMARIWSERATCEIPHPGTVGTAVVGTAVGVPVIGAAEGEAERTAVGVPVTGANEGEAERAAVGLAVFGIRNRLVGKAVVGKAVGLFDGWSEGNALGLTEGS